MSWRERARIALSVLTGVLVVAGAVAGVWFATAPGEKVVVVDSPMMAAEVPIPEVTTTAPLATTSTVVVQAASRPVAVPAKEYAPEPVLAIGRIEIPKIGLDHQTFHGITMRNIDRGPSHWPGTALPGETGNTVYMGHRVTKTHPFRNIDRLVPGDEVFFTVEPTAFGGSGEPVRTRYLVTGHEIVPPTALRIVDPTPTPTATLFACHPPGSARFRYVVRLELAPLQPA